MPHDVFVSYSTSDKSTADAVCAKLEQRAIRCWIAPRDIQPGCDWASAIVTAIEDARLVVVVFSARANISPQIVREVERAVTAGTPIIPFRIEDVAYSKTLAYFLGSSHWLDALTPPIDAHINRLGDVVLAILSGGRQPVEVPLQSRDVPARPALPVPMPPAPGAALIADDSYRPHYFYGGGVSRDLGLQLSFMITNPGRRTVTLIRPEIKIDDPDVKATFRYWRIETGSGRETVSLGKGRTAETKAEFRVVSRTCPRDGDAISGLLIIKLAQPGVGPVAQRFAAIYAPDQWKP